MGGVGSLFIGFTIAAFGVLGARVGLPLWVFLSVLAFYFFDVCYTLTRRLLRGENVLEAHHKHLYQRLGRLGWSHGRIKRRDVLHHLHLWFGRLSACGR